jgi:hypothetical protein
MSLGENKKIDFTYKNCKLLREFIIMNTKLTLQLNKEVIELAKQYAKDQNTSLSKLIESILSKLVHEKKEMEISPLVKSLSGVIDLPADYDYKSEYADYLAEKYK